MVKVNLAFAEHTSDDWRLNAGCAARRGLILLIRYRVPIGSATSTLVQRGAFINAHRTVLLVRPWWHAGRQRLSACSCLLLVWHIHRKIGMSGGLFTNQLLRETAVEIDPERVERLQRAHARAYQQYSVQIPPTRRAQAARLAHRNTNSLGYRYQRPDGDGGGQSRNAQRQSLQALR